MKGDTGSDWYQKRYRAWDVLKNHGYDWSNDAQGYIDGHGNFLPSIVTDLLIEVVVEE